MTRWYSCNHRKTCKGLQTNCIDHRILLLFVEFSIFIHLPSVSRKQYSTLTVSILVSNRERRNHQAGQKLRRPRKNKCMFWCRDFWYSENSRYTDFKQNFQSLLHFCIAYPQTLPKKSHFCNFYTFFSKLGNLVKRECLVNRDARLTGILRLIGNFTLTKNTRFTWISRSKYSRLNNKFRKIQA